MIKKRNLVIELAGSCFYNMLRTGIESFPKEATGYLYGVQNNERYILYNAYPIQTAVRNFTTVSYGNDAAIERLRKLEEAIGANNNGETYLKGGYHTHPPTSSNTLSDHDLDFIEKEMDGLRKEEWVEIILRIKQIEYEKKRIKEVFVRNYKNKLGIILIDGPFHGYKITISAYLIGDSNIDELKIEKREIEVKEKRGGK